MTTFEVYQLGTPGFTSESSGHFWHLPCLKKFSSCSMKTGLRRNKVRNKTQAGFTLVEVVVSLAICTMGFAGVIYGYVQTTAQAKWSNYSLAAQSFANQGVEQARSAQWDPRSWPAVDELGTTNYTSAEQLDVVGVSSPVWATNYVSVTDVSITPPLRQLRADCVWYLAGGGKGAHKGPFTNTAISLRAAGQ